MEEYKKRIAKMLQTMTMVIYFLVMAAFAVFLLGIVDADIGDDFSAAFAFVFMFLGVMSFIVYSPRIINFVGDLIIKLLSKKKNKGKADELLYCLLFALAPMIILALLIGVMALLFIIM